MDDRTNRATPPFVTLLGLATKAAAGEELKEAPMSFRPPSLPPAESE